MSYRIPDGEATKTMTVDEALNELREMFPGQFWQVSFTQNGYVNPDGGIQQGPEVTGKEARVWSSVNCVFEHYSLDAAMRKVRAWHKEQSK